MTDTRPDVAVDEGAETKGSKSLVWALVLISVAQLMVVLDGTIVNIALPYIQSDLDIAQSNLTWVVTGYALAFGSLLLLGGRLGDLYGRRRIFVFGLAIFAVASGLGGLATNEGMLLAARGLQGLGAALASPAALALITTTFPAGPARNRAFAIYAAMSGVGAAVGLLLGGWLTGLTPSLGGLDIDGWRLTLLINLPIGLAAAFLAPRYLRESEVRDHALDLPGAILGTLGLLGLVYGFSRAGSDGWTDQWTLASLIAGSVVLVVFVFVESRTEDPLLPFRVFMHRTRAASYAAMFLAPAAMFSMFFFLSQYIQNVMGYSPIKTGVAFLPFCVALVFAAGLSSNLINRIDPRVLGGIGTVLAAAGLYGFSRLPLRHHRPGELRRGFVRQRPAAVHRADVVRHGHDLRAADADRCAPPARGGHRHRLGCAQHHAAGGRRARPGDPRQCGDPDRHRPFGRARSAHGQSPASVRWSSPRARRTRSWWARS